MRSGKFSDSGSRILAVPLDAGLPVQGPFFVDLDAGGADESQEGVLARKDPDLVRTARWAG
ncbi:hypothetical protein CCR87_03860 [Rhodobaculum claviforme]|uniref:Uncharacterized protein n=1 Tax=Rhodobaculum claviforme TaxID=1549854 RepID=A0A934TIL1_9RHOB|nr:hypothetical protein [Rhodobaculum claviforme]